MIYLNAIACAVLSFGAFHGAKELWNSDHAAPSIVTYAVSLLFAAAAIVNLQTILK